MRNCQSRSKFAQSYERLLKLEEQTQKSTRLGSNLPAQKMGRRRVCLRLWMGRQLSSIYFELEQSDFVFFSFSIYDIAFKNDGSQLVVAAGNRVLVSSRAT